MAVEHGRAKYLRFVTLAALWRAVNVGLNKLLATVESEPAQGGRAMTHGLLSIGYEGRTIDSFVKALVAAGTDIVVDVRLTPISRKPGFSKSRLNAALNEAGIEYLHLRSLGNPKSNREPFWSGRAHEGRAVFRELMAADASVEAIRLLSGLAERHVVAVLCFESEDAKCHRQVVIDEVTKVTPMPVLSLS